MTLASRLVSAIAVGTVALPGVLVAVAQPAHALRTGQWECGLNNYYFGANSEAEKRAQTTDQQCGSVSVRIGYRVTSSGTTYYTSWVTGTNLASTTTSSIPWLSQHKVSQCGVAYSCGPNSLSF
jgi:hypothetical protein